MNLNDLEDRTLADALDRLEQSVGTLELGHFVPDMSFELEEAFLDYDEAHHTLMKAYAEVFQAAGVIPKFV